jgi:hypothetical protein
VQKQVRREKPGFLKKSSRCCNGAVVVLRDRVGQLQSVAARHELGGDVKMTEYRLYTVENDGHFIGSRTFTADSDDDAVVWAKQQIEDHSVELWSGPRLLRRLDPAEKRAAKAVTHTIEAGRMVPKNKT